MKKTLAVVVLGRVSFHRSATFLIDVEDDQEWEDATEEALTRASRGVDVEWNDIQAAPNHWVAMISESQELVELITLLTAQRDHPGGLNPGEQAWLDELLTRVAVSQEEIERFNRRGER